MGKAGSILGGLCVVGALLAVQGALTVGGGSEASVPYGGHLALDLSTTVGQARVTGLPDLVLESIGEGALRIYPVAADWQDPSFPSVAGHWRVANEVAWFEPRHPLMAGETYRLIVDWDGADTPAVLEASVPSSRPLERAEVLAVYPTGPLLPENQLKLYIQFSQPMHRWDPYDHIRLVDLTTGQPVDAAFHALRDGLWNAAGTRLTVVFDPGRIKRGLANNEVLGPPLVPGHQYRLEVEETWLAATGDPLRAPYIKTFTAGDADRTSPSPATWTVQVPSSPEAAVRLDFGETMDWALLEDLVWVRGPDRTDISLDVTIVSEQSRWSGTPHEPWADGEYRILVDCRIEDLAGNNVERLFDIDLSAEGPVADTDSEGCAVKIPFTVSHDTSQPDAKTLEGGQ